MGFIKNLFKDPIRATMTELFNIGDANKNMATSDNLGNRIAAGLDPSDQVTNVTNPEVNNLREDRIANARAEVAANEGKKVKNTEERSANAAAEEARIAQGRKRGRASTMLNGGEGVSTGGMSLRRTLLGN